MTQCRYFVVEGRVQGVFYRASTQQKAKQLGLTGWVRNLPDGNVDLVACGDERSLELLVKWLWQGPQMALVQSINEKQTADEGFDGFSIRY